MAAVLVRPGAAPPGWLRVAVSLVGGSIVASLLIAWAGWATRGNVDRYFGEQRPGTLLSASLLFASAETCRRIHGLAPAAAAFGRFWIIQAVFFLYLGLDELFRIHERLDWLAHRLAGLHHRNPVTDHLDDAIVVAYALFAAALWYRHRCRLLGLPWTLRAITAAFLAFAAMMAVDVTAEAKAIEDSLKILSGALILCGFLAAGRELTGPSKD